MESSATPFETEGEPRFLADESDVASAVPEDPRPIEEVLADAGAEIRLSEDESIDIEERVIESGDDVLTVIERSESTLGFRQGPWRCWFEDGKPACEGAYHDGRLEGEWRCWYRSGNLALQRTYGKCQVGVVVPGEHGDEPIEDSDVPCGDETTWWPNGNKRSHSTRVGLVAMDGEETTYHENGQLESRGQWKDGGREGVWTWFHPNGAKASEGVMSGGREGRWSFWDEAGHRTAEAEYHVDSLNGVAREWYPDGRPKAEETFVDDQREGPCKYWTPDGELEPRSGRYAKDERVGD